ncbi:MAG: TIGR00730 family Rossman fold protein [Polyangiaceae bacterium]
MAQPSIGCIAVFCGASEGSKPAYKLAAQRLGALFAQRDITLVYGGGNVGLMGAIADAVIDHGGKAIGVIPEKLLARELGHRRVTELHVVDSMHTRKAMMADRADAFIAMPGGFGTFEELFEIITWSQLGLHPKPKPVGLLNVNGYYEPVIHMIDHAVSEGFIRASDRELVQAHESPEALLDLLSNQPVTSVDRWLDREST